MPIVDLPKAPTVKVEEDDWKDFLGSALPIAGMVIGGVIGGVTGGVPGAAAGASLGHSAGTVLGAAFADSPGEMRRQADAGLVGGLNTAPLAHKLWGGQEPRSLPAMPYKPLPQPQYSGISPLTQQALGTPFAQSTQFDPPSMQGMSLTGPPQATNPYSSLSLK